MKIYFPASEFEAANYIDFFYKNILFSSSEQVVYLLRSENVHNDNTEGFRPEVERYMIHIF